MNYYLIIIESRINPNENLVSIFKGKQQLQEEDLRPIISLMENHINCFLNGEGKTLDQIGKLSLYKLIDLGKIPFQNEYETGETMAEEEIETGEIYVKPVMASYNYDVIQEAHLILEWENYDSFKEERGIQTK